MLGRSAQVLCNSRVIKRAAPLKYVHQQLKFNVATARYASGLIPFKLADIGEGIAEVELLKWFVKEGDVIRSFDRVCEVQSDKATVEITSRYDGVIAKVYHAEGDIVKVGSTLIDITTADDGKAKAVSAPVAATKPAAKAAPVAAASSGAVIPFKLADIGEGIAEVELMKWYVKEGDVIRAFDKVCEVQSDKATVEITSRFDGIVAKVYSVEGDVVKVGSTLIDIRTEGGAAAPAAPAAASNHGHGHGHGHQAPAAEFSRQAGIPVAGKILTTPAVRKIAKENHLDLHRVPGTGPKGRILKEDVLNFISGKTAPSSSNKAAAAPVATKSAPASTSVTHVSPAVVTAADQRVPIRGIQRMMVKSMTESLQIPHLGYCEEVTFDRMKALREALKADLGKRGIKFSYMPLLIKATSMALSHYPVLNASITESGTEMIYHSNHNIGLAMDTPKGLLVPVIKAVQTKSILDIAIELGQLQEAAAKGTLNEAQLSGGTFSLSNIGSIGGTYAAPVVVVPQVAIGALGRLQVLPRYVNKRGDPADMDAIERGEATVAPVTVMNVSWSADHRVVEGATIARFSNKWKQFIENPQLMITELR